MKADKRAKRDRASEKRLAVVICTYNRQHVIGDCLESIFQQECPESDYEVIVVNNNCTDATDAVVESFAVHHPNLQLVYEKRQGLSYARNRGLESAQTSWIAYLDDDAKANPDWLNRILERIDEDRFDAFGGPFLPWYKEGRMDWYRDEYATNLSWMKTRTLALLESECFSGGNAVYRKSAVLQAGGFPLDLGMMGDQTGYGEESYLQNKMREQGFRIGFDPDLIIWHLVPMRKQSLAWFRRAKRAEGQAFAKVHGISPSIRNLAYYVLAYAAVDVRELAKALWRWLAVDYRWQNVYIDIVPRLIFQYEVLRGLLAARRADSVE